MVRACVVGLVVGLMAASASAAEPKDRLEALNLIPDSAIAFCYLPNIRTLEDDLKRFARETGWQIGHGEHPVLDILAHRTGIPHGLDANRSACIGYLDPKRFRDRYTVYVLPVADWDALLRSTQGEEMTSGLYALTGTAGPRFVARRGSYAVVTSSIRTMDALTDARGIAAALPPATLSRLGAEGVFVYLNVRRLKEVYEGEIVSWFRASSGQVYNQAEAVAYADMMVTYMLGIASFLDQMETLDAGLRFGPEGLSVDLGVRFVEGAGMANFLAQQAPGATPIPAVADRPLTSAVTMLLNPETRTSLALRATQFFLEEAPRPEPLPESTKRSVYEAIQAFTESLGEHMTFISAPAAPGMGMTTDVTILDLKDPEEFQRSLALMVTAWESLADQLNLYLKFQAAPEEESVEGVPVTRYLPRLRFGIPARHVEFRENLRKIYGPEGLVYRVAIVGRNAVIATGSDPGLFRQTIKRLKAAGPHEESPVVKRLEQILSPDQNVRIVTSLPLVLGQSLTRGGTPAGRLGTIDPGREAVGIGLRAEKAGVMVSSYWPHEQIRLTRELLIRAAPDLAEVPKSLFEPTPEGPPRGGKAPPAALFGPPPPVVPPKEDLSKPWVDFLKPLFGPKPEVQSPAPDKGTGAEKPETPPTPGGRDLFKSLFGPPSPIKPPPPPPLPGQKAKPELPKEEPPSPKKEAEKPVTE